jgi:hypothetical protein
MSINFYQNKYLKYKKKYLNLTGQYGGGFKCDLTKRVKEKLCIEDDDPSNDREKADCENICSIEKLTHEITIWENYLRVLLTDGRHIYAKGGSILGIIVLKDLLLNKPITQELINEYNEMNLIKDWDLTIVNVADDIKSSIISKGIAYEILDEATAFPVLRYKDGILIADENLLELSIKTSENLSDLEVPLTAIKFELKLDNLSNFLNLIKLLFNQNTIFDNIGEIKRILELLDLTPTNIRFEDGFFTVSSEQFNNGGLSPELLSTMELSSPELSHKQFLVSQFKEPDRLIYRLLDKNLKKSNNIRNLYSRHGLSPPAFLINEDKIKTLITTFFTNLNIIINRKFSETIESCFDNQPAKMEIAPGTRPTKEQKQAEKEANDVWKGTCTPIINSFFTYIGTLFNNVNLARFDKYRKVDIADINLDLKKLILLSLCPVSTIQILRGRSITNRTIETVIKMRTVSNKSIESYANFLNGMKVLTL